MRITCMHAQPYTCTADTAEWLRRLGRLVPYLVDKERHFFLMMSCNVVIINKPNK